MDEIPLNSPPRSASAKLMARGAERLAEFILTLAHDDNGIGAYVRAFVAGDDVGECQRLLDRELDAIRAGEREYDWRHKRGYVFRRRVDHVLDAIELVVMPADAQAAFQLLTRLIESDNEIAEHTGDAWLEPTFERACCLWKNAAKNVAVTVKEEAFARLKASNAYGLRGGLSTSGGS